MLRFALYLSVVVGVGCGDVVKATSDASACSGSICECTVETEDTACGEHQTCEVGGGNSECKCVAGYTESADGTCEFGVVPADPGFQDSSKWTLGGMATIDTAAPGGNQPGELVMDGTALCNFGQATQTFTMPPFDKSVPLKLSVSSRVDDPSGMFFSSMLMQVAVGTQFVEMTAVRGAEFRTQTACLGPAAFGGETQIRISTAQTVSCAVGAQAALRIDEVKIEAASSGECPKQPGAVNGTFQLSTGWAFQGLNGGTGQIIANIGENSSFAAQLSQPTRCAEVRAVGTLMVPPVSQVAHPALDVYWNGPSGTRLVVGFGNKSIGTLNATGLVKHSRLCLPKWTIGNTASLSFLAQRLQDALNCTALGRNFVLDNITVVDEPSCGDPADITDPSFERIANVNGPMPGWGLINGFVNDLEGGRSTVINSSANAKSGVGTLQSVNSNACVSTGAFGAENAFVVPAVSGTQGPAIKFNAKADAANVESETRAQLFPLVNIFKAVSETGTYSPYVLCIPPGLAGKLVAFRLVTGRVGGGGCGQNYAEQGFFDDVSIGTDASCPAQ